MPPQLSLEQKGMILGLRIGGFSIRNIAQKLDVSKNTVLKWLQRHEAEGTMSQKPRTGRPKLVTEEDKDKLIAAYALNPSASIEQLTETAGLNVSRHTVARVLEEAGIRKPTVKRPSVGAARKIKTKSRTRSKPVSKPSPSARRSPSAKGESSQGKGSIRVKTKSQVTRASEKKTRK